MKAIRLFTFIMILILAAIWIFPFASAMITMVKSPDQFNETFFWQRPGLLEGLANLKANIAEAQTQTDIGSNIGNSSFYAIAAGLISSFIGAMAAYALVVLKAPRGNLWFMYIFIGNLFPFQMFLIPLYLMTNRLGLYDTLHGMLLIYTGICVPFAVFVYRNYSKSMNLSTFEASRIDGAGDWAAFFRIFLPMSKPAYLVIFIFQFTWTWNDLLFGLILSERNRPIMTAISKLVGQRGSVPVPITMTGAIMASVPTVILLLALQKQFLQGFSIITEK